MANRPSLKSYTDISYGVCNRTITPATHAAGDIIFLYLMGVGLIKFLIGVEYGFN